MSLAGSVLLPGNVVAQDDEVLEPFTVTGSRIPRLDLEGVSPVVVISAQDV